MKDLACLVADRNQAATIQALLDRPRAMGMRTVTFDVFVHPQRDPGCFQRGHEFLRPLRSAYLNALVLFDQAWEGAPSQDASVLETAVRERLRGAGQEAWADVVVIAPELEVWVWSDSPHVGTALGWGGRRPGVRVWLREKGLWPEEVVKPPDPKRAVEQALFETKVPRSSAVYERIARKVSVNRCRDESFHRLRARLGTWFPPR